MKKNLIKFLITVSILLTTFNANILAQSKISGEKLEKLLTENHIIIYNVYGGGDGFELNFNFKPEKRYKSTSEPSYNIKSGSYTYKQPSSGTWEIFNYEKNIVSLNDNQMRTYKLLFGDDGNIYDLDQKLYSYRLENKEKRIEKEKEKEKKEKIAEELRLKKIEEEKRQFAIKHPEEIKKRDEMRKKAEDDRQKALDDLRKREPVDPRKLVDRQEVYFSELGIQRNGISHMICTYGDGSKIKAKFIRDHYHNGCPASK